MVVLIVIALLKQTSVMTKYINMLTKKLSSY